MRTDKKRARSACPLCGGSKKAGRTTFTADFGDGVVVIRHVPASVCAQCGEEWIAADTARKIEAVVTEARSKGAQLEVVGL